MNLVAGVAFAGLRTAVAARSGMARGLGPDDPATASMVTLHSSMPIPKDAQKPDSKETVNVDVLGAAVGNPDIAAHAAVFV